MKFLVGYNMKIVVFSGDETLLGAFFLVEEDYPRIVRMMEFY